MAAPSIMWFRRDLRLADNPALLAAASAGLPVVPLYVIDPVLFGGSGAPRAAFLVASLRELAASMGEALVVRHGAPCEVVSAVAAEVGASQVFAAEDFGPYGARRDRSVASQLTAHGRELRLIGSSYAVPPGRVRKDDGRPYSVFTPFSRSWRAVGWPAPVAAAEVDWLGGPAVRSDGLPVAPEVSCALPSAGERAAHERLDEFVGSDLDAYAEQRDRPDLAGTSSLSPYLRWGALHPRQALAHLGDSKAHTVFRNELAWREFYADVLHDHPLSAWHDLQPKLSAMTTDDGPVALERFAAWCAGRTGYPIVDAGMRQLAATGWMHNRVRMIVASFLVKDLHLPWQWGARFFMDHLVDGDLASNNHGWQWTAGTGTDAAPYFRIFNPVLQAERYDPDGAYVRRWVPELAHVPRRDLHAPWTARSGSPLGYEAPIVDHATERDEALRRFSVATGGDAGETSGG